MSSQLIKALVTWTCHVLTISQSPSDNGHAMSSQLIKTLMTWTCHVLTIRQSPSDNGHATSKSIEGQNIIYMMQNLI